MKRFAMVTGMILAAISLSAPTNAQQWEWQNPLPQLTWLSDIYFADSLHGWATGWDQLLARTVDGGRHWQTSDLAVTTARPRSIFFTDTLNGWIAFEWGVILHSTDGGESWVQQQSGTTNNFFEVYFRDVNHGWAVADYGTIVRTTDGGTTWETARTGELADYCSLSFISDSVGFVASMSFSGFVCSLLKTTDAGSTWQSTTLPYCYSLPDAEFVSEQHGWLVCGHEHILRTADGGQTWEDDSTSYWGSYAMAADFVDSLHGWFSADGGRIQHTTDGGITWHLQRPQTSARLYGFCAVDTNRAWAAGDDGGIYKTIDGGQQWTVSNGVAISQLWDVCALDSENAWAVGDDGTVLRARNGGAWEALDLGTRHSFNGVGCWGRDRVWVAGDSATIFFSSDGGQTWDQQNSGLAVQSPIIKLCVVDSVTVWATFGNAAAGYNRPMIIYTTDGGLNWHTPASGSATDELGDITFSGHSQGWCVGDWGTILHTTDGGATWIAQASGGEASLRDVHFVDERHGWIAGSTSGVSGDGILLSTVNGGATWQQRSTWPEERLYGVYFVDSLEGWVVSSFGVVRHSTDGGATWNTEIDIGPRLNSVSIADDRSGWVVGNRGAILRRTAPQDPDAATRPGGIPTTFTLSAYPNPFNPSTTLSFDLPQTGHVDLQVYDVTGRLVKTLANKVYGAGHYSLSLDGATLSSGIYFAQLRNSSAIQTHKLVLLK